MAVTMIGSWNSSVQSENVLLEVMTVLVFSYRMAIGDRHFVFYDPYRCVCQPFSPSNCHQYFIRLSIKKLAFSGGLAFGLASRADAIASLIDLAARIDMSL